MQVRDGVVASPYSLYVERYAGGCGAEECRAAKHVVHWRGDIPCDVMFVGEAPGESEDCLGRPFVGPSGHLLDVIVAASCGHHCVCSVCELNGVTSFCQVIDGASACRTNSTHDRLRPVTVGFTNVVGCAPRGGSGHLGAPSFDQIESCSSRFNDVAALARPRLMVCVGEVASNSLDARYRTSIVRPKSVVHAVTIAHPSSILRSNVVRRSLMVQKCIADVIDALDRVSTHQTAKT